MDDPTVPSSDPACGDDAGRRAFKVVGYWHDPNAPRTETLPDPTQLVDQTWNRRERAAVARYLRRGKTLRACHGFSWCRFRCGISDRRMGHRDLTDGVYVWPEGLAHYVQRHRVRLPDEFLAHVRTRLEQRRRERSVGVTIRRWLAKLRGMTTKGAT
jgi:hypothetical protein